MIIKKVSNEKANYVLFLFVVVCFLQLSGLKGLANYISAGLMLFAGLLTINYTRGKIHVETLLVFLFIIFYVLTSVPKIDVKYCVTYTINFFLAFSPVMMLGGFRTICKDTWEVSRRKILKNVLIVWYAMAFISIVFYIRFPGAARILAANGDAFTGTLIGGYTLAYGSALLCVALLEYSLNKTREKKQKKWLLLGCAVLAVLVYLTQSTLTFFATILGVLVTLVTKTATRGNRKLIYYTLLLSISIGLFFVVYIEIENHIYQIIVWLNARNNILVFRRIREVLISLFLDVQTRHYSERTGLVSESLKLFMRSPLIGHGYKYGNVFSAGKEYGIGNHSEFFDCLAKYGIIGFTPLLLLYYKYMKATAKYSPGVVASFVMLVLFNPFISFASSLSVFLLIPLLYDMKA